MTEIDRTPLIDVEGVTKRYGKKIALDALSLRVPRGRTVALIGPNGAGKTTFVEILMGLRDPDEGRVSVLGVDVRRDPRGHVDRIGVQLQGTQMFARVTAREYLALFQGLYPRALETDALAGRLCLEDVLDVPIGRLSGGLRQRVALALAIVNDPELIILDEPTVGLDPLARQQFWSLIRQLQAEGRSLLFSTHYMDEAQSLADDIVMISNGRIAANGSASDIIEQARIGGARTLDEAYGVVVQQSLQENAA